MSNEVQCKIDFIFVLCFDFFSRGVFEKCLEHFELYIDNADRQHNVCVWEGGDNGNGQRS